MNPIVKSLLGSVLAAAVCGPALAQSKGSPKPSVSPSLKAELNALRSAMTFYLAKGEPGSCGQGCSEWIAGEGTIEFGTAERMRSFLKGQRGAKRPIYFYSPGGVTSEALAIGRLMRERGLTAGVARTIPQDCEADQKKCASLKRSSRELNAVLTSDRAQCSSACVWAIVGARIREIAPEAGLGVHAAKTVITTKLPAGTKVPRDLMAKFKADHKQQVRRYLVEMGIHSTLLEVAEKTPHESIKRLTRDEIARFGIDTRSFVESRWMSNERLSDTSSVIKLINAAEKGSNQFRTTVVQLRCLGADQFAVAYARELGPKEEPSGPLKVNLGGQEFQLTPKGEPVRESDTSKRYDLKLAWVPSRLFESAATEGHIEIADAGPSGDKLIAKLSTIGLSSTVANLIARCRAQVSPTPGFDGAALAPLQRP